MSKGKNLNRKEEGRNPRKYEIIKVNKTFFESDGRTENQIRKNQTKWGIKTK